MPEYDSIVYVAGIILALIIVAWTWKSVKTVQFNMEAARSRRMSQVRAARGNAPITAASPTQQEVTPQWVFSLLERLGIDEIPEQEPAGLAEALDKYEPLIQPFIKGLMEGQQQQQGQQPGPVFL